MACLRRLLAWLLLAALPLQGYAAAAMPGCGMAGSATRMAAGIGHAQATHADGQLHAQGHVHAQDHAHECGHAHAGRHAPAGDHDAATAATDAGQSPAPGHGCGACAAACHAVALASAGVTIAAGPAPGLLRAQAGHRYDSWPPTVPDKPPRA